MEVAIHLPDDIAQHVQAQWEDVPRHVLESLALAWYQSGELNEEQLRRLLGYSTRMGVHAFLKEHGVPLRYTLEDLSRTARHMTALVFDAGCCRYLADQLSRTAGADGVIASVVYPCISSSRLVLELRDPEAPEAVQAWAASLP